MTTWTKKPSWSTVDNEEELHWDQDNNNWPVCILGILELLTSHSAPPWYFQPRPKVPWTLLHLGA